jgi:phage regulator Rha-like protein
MKEQSLIPVERIEQKIFLIRNQKVMLSMDLASLYGVEHRVIMQAVRRNIERFPSDFMFQINVEEWEILKSQFVISSWGGTRKLPFAFTEHGILMLSSVLKSKRAVQVNIAIMRTFVKLRHMLESNAELARKLEEMEKKYDAQFKVVFDTLRKLLAPPASQKQPIGFRVGEPKAKYTVRKRK